MNEGLKKNAAWLKCHRLAPDFLHFVTNVSDALDFQQERADFLYRRLHSLRRQVRKVVRHLEPTPALPPAPTPPTDLAKETELLRKQLAYQQEENNALKSRLLQLETTMKELLKSQKDQSLDNQVLQGKPQYNLECSR